MKKAAVLAMAVLCMIFFFGCSGTKSKGSAPAFAFDAQSNYTGLNILPSGYTADNAAKDGYPVTQNGEFTANRDVWQTFLGTAAKGKNTSVRWVDLKQGESNPYFTDLFYQDGYYYRFVSNGGDMHKNPYRYLLVLKKPSGGSGRYNSITVLTDNYNLTYDQVKPNNSDELSVSAGADSTFAVIMYEK